MYGVISGSIEVFMVLIFRGNLRGVIVRRNCFTRLDVVCVNVFSRWVLE